MTTPIDRVAVVTGSARNIGRTTVLKLHQMGVSSIIVHAKQDRAGVDETVALLKDAGANAIGHLADLSEETGAESLITAAMDSFGRVDILVNNAALRRNTLLAEITLAEWQEVLAVNLQGAFLCTRAAVPHMQAQNYGRIVNVGGIAAHRGVIGRTHVAAAKAGLVGFTKALATELAGDGIVANCVVPGMVETVRGAAAGAIPSHVFEHKTLIGREGYPDEIAHIIVMLCHADAAFTTGQTVHVSGGAYLA